MADLEYAHTQPVASTSRHRHTASTGSASAAASAPGTPRRERERHHSSNSSSNARSRGTLGTAGRPPHHRQALSAIRAFLRRESCFDILPESFRMIVFDNKLLIKRALVALQTNGVVSAPLYDSSAYRFVGMFTMVDVIHLIQYYYLSATGYDNAAVEVETVDLSALRDIEVAIDVPPPPIISVHPDDQLYTACAALVRTHARRLPLIDRDEVTGKETIVSVLTQYRVLKFIAINCRQECSRLTESIGTLGLGTYISSFSPAGEALNSKGSLQQQQQAPQSRRQRSRSNLPTPRPSGIAGSMPSTGASTPNPANTASQQPAPGRAEEGLPQDWDESFAANAAAGLPPSSAPQNPLSAVVDEEDEELANPPLPVDSAHMDSAGLVDQHTPASTASHSSFARNTPATNTPATSSNYINDRFHPLATATLQTTVFDVVHLFSDLGISAVPIVDNETGQVVNLYEAVDVVDLVRSNAYQVLDLTIEDALNRRSKDFPGVVTCTPEDSLASIMAYIREKRAHRFIIVEGDETSPDLGGLDPEDGDGSKPKKVPGRLLGILCLSDLLKYFVGSGSLSGVKVVGLGFRSEEEGLAIPRVVDDEELDELNEGVSGLGIQ